jgi:hypothetical protein
MRLNKTPEDALNEVQKKVETELKRQMKYERMRDL